MKKVTLISSDNEWFEVSEAAASLSQTIRSAIPLHEVNGKVLAMVLEYCNKHAAAVSPKSEEAATPPPEAGSSDSETDVGAAALGSGGTSNNEEEEEELKSFDEAFMDVDQYVLYDLLLATNFLEVRGLLDLACQKAADMIKGKTAEEIRQTFGIEYDFVWEEEEEENQWF